MRASDLVRDASARLGSAAEARTLVAYVLGVEPGALALADANDADARALAPLVERRRAGEPLQHLTGRAYFRSVVLDVGPGVFVPRPETELLAGWALERLDSLGPDAVVVELCAGSGAVSASLVTEHPAASYTAVELSDDALPYLRRNVDGLGVRVVEGDMAEALHELDGLVDLVVVNPPYVPEAARADLPADVLADPDLALFSGVDGLDALCTVAEVATRLLKPGGWLGSEHDDSQGESAPALLTASGFVDVADHLDLAGRPRYATARRP